MEAIFAGGIFRRAKEPTVLYYVRISANINGNMRKKRVLVFLGDSDNEKTSCGGFADAYERGAREAGHEVRRVNIGEMKFDPILHHGYRIIQPLEPDLLKLQDDFRWAEHIALFYPNWWGTMPAILKGLFDRFYIPGFAFRFNKNGFGWHALLKGRTAHVFIAMGSSPWIQRLLFGDNSNEIRSAILGFAGIRTTVTKIGGMKNVSPERRARLEKKFLRWGANAD